MWTFAFGFPKLGEKREFKTSLEDLWKGKIDREEFLKGMEKLNVSRVEEYKRNVDIISSNEVSFYDFMLDTALMVGAIPQRFGEFKGFETYFEMARGGQALEMTKWFNTNYHYLVPEMDREDFRLLENKPLKDYLFFKRKGIETSPMMIGPYTFLKLSKTLKRKEKSTHLSTVSKIEQREDFARFTHLLLPIYKEVLESLKEAGCRRVHIEEPALVMDMAPWQWDTVQKIYTDLSDDSIEIALITYYDSVSDYEKFVALPVKALGFDLVSNRENLSNLKSRRFPKDKELIAGIINGRQVWRANLKEKLHLIDNLLRISENVIISNSSPLYHLPVTVGSEDHLPEGLKDRLSFAKEKLEEIKTLKLSLNGDREAIAKVDESENFMKTSFAQNPRVRTRLAQLSEKDFKREMPYKERAEATKKILNLSPFPTTTIGSFPQTEELRKKRTAYRNGKIPNDEYMGFIRSQIQHVISVQEELGLDVFVHGEFERTDMVEFFAQKLDGVATTTQGWVISYGSRVYRPPIIYGDVKRPEPMTLEEITYAQSLTTKPLKGMLTGPVTILNWSFYREDTPKKEIAYQIALALLDEVRDLETAGIRIIQIDEPAFREGAPLKRKDWEEYFGWAVKAFKLASRAGPSTQLHTHMCYSEFNEIIDFIYQLDFDVISIEASRSKGEVIEAFQRLKTWDRQIGIGVYDIHSPAIPAKENMQSVLDRVMKVLPKELLWINPDCGLKTRRWEEVLPALRDMVKIASENRS